MASRVPIGRRLLQAGVIDAARLKSALAPQRQWSGRLGDALVALWLVSEQVLMTELAKQHGVPYIVIGERRVPKHVFALLPEKIIRRRKVLPVGYGENPRTKSILVATKNCPHDLFVLDEVGCATRMKVKPILAGERDLDRAIERRLGPAPPVLQRSWG